MCYLNCSMSYDRYTCGSLFSGIGGFCFGFECAGFRTLWAVDIDQHATSAYKENFSGTKVIREDIRTVNTESTLEPVDVLHAGFPCQSFSRAGNRRGFDDERGQLFFEIENMIKRWKDKKPSVLVLENSVFLLSGRGGQWFNKVRVTIQRLGYWFSASNATIIDTSKHAGLPQRRERLFMVAVAMDRMQFNPFTGVDPAKKKINLEEIMNFGEQKEVYYMPEHNKYTKRILGEAQKYKDFRLFQLRRTELRPQPPGVCPTLTANMGAGGHNVPFIIDGQRLRKLTENECLKLQGFVADSFKWGNVPLGPRYRLIGNAVSPMISAKIAVSVKNMLERYGNAY